MLIFTALKESKKVRRFFNPSGIMKQLLFLTLFFLCSCINIDDDFNDVFIYVVDCEDNPIESGKIKIYEMQSDSSYTLLYSEILDIEHSINDEANCIEYSYLFDLPVNNYSFIVTDDINNKKTVQYLKIESNYLSLKVCD